MSGSFDAETLAELEDVLGGCAVDCYDSCEVLSVGGGAAWVVEGGGECLLVLADAEGLGMCGEPG